MHPSHWIKSRWMSLRWIVPWLVVAVILCIPLRAQAGGWAVITLIDLPHRVQVRQPTAIEFVVRQHGHPDRPLSDLSPLPLVTATSGGQTVQVSAEPGTAPGRYQATLTLPVAGTWDWSIQAFILDVAMPPLIAYDADAPDAPLILQQMLRLIGWQPVTRPAAQPRPLAEQGRDLFIAKGCATCHRHADVQMEFVTELGPDLTHYEADAEFVAVWLRNAEAFTSNSDWPMPTLELTDGEIDALIAFLGE